MQKSAIATLTVLILMTMTLSSTLVGMPVEEEPVRSLTEEDRVCTSDGDCPDGYICSSTGECVKPQTCDMDGDCSDGQICQDGICIDNPDQEDGNGCESNEDCTDGQYCDENGECADDSTQDDSCTSDADCADGQICGAAGECMDAPDDSGNETDGNETNDGGDESPSRCMAGTSFSFSMVMKDGLHVCDEETGEWVELEDTRPTSVEIGCDEEPTEEQLDASNFADLLNEHDEILIRDGNDTIRMRTMNGSGGSYLGLALCPSFNAVNDSNDCWVDFEITPTSQVFLIDIENNHSRTEMVVIEEENATHVSVGFSRVVGWEDATSSGSIDGRSNSSDFNEQKEIFELSRLSVSLNGSDVYFTGRSSVSLNGSDVYFSGRMYNGSVSLNGSTVFGAGDIIHIRMVDDRRHINNTDLLGLERLATTGASSGIGIIVESMSLSDVMFQIGMDENGNVTSVHNFNKECLRFEDIESTDKDDGDEPEDESSNVLVAAGGVEVTTRDAAVAGVAAGTTALLSSVIRRITFSNPRE